MGEGCIKSSRINSLVHLSLVAGRASYRGFATTNSATLDLNAGQALLLQVYLKKIRTFTFPMRMHSYEKRMLRRILNTGSIFGVKRGRPVWEG